MLLPEWPPNSVGVEVTQWREERHHLGAAETVNHATQLLAVHHLGVSVLPHAKKSCQQPKSPLLIVWYLLHTKCLLNPPAWEALYLLHCSLLAQIPEVSTCCWSWVIFDNPSQNSDLLTGRGKESPEESRIPTQDLVPHADLFTSKESLHKVCESTPWYSPHQLHCGVPTLEELLCFIWLQLPITNMKPG